jgi:hypothetical protein
MSILNLKEDDKFYLKKSVTLQNLIDIAFSVSSSEKFLKQRKENKPFIIHKHGIKENKIYFNHEGYYAFFLVKMCETNSRTKKIQSNHFFTKMFLLDVPKIKKNSIKVN